MSAPKDQAYTVLSVLQVAKDTISKIFPSIANDSRCDTAIFNSVIGAIQKRAAK